MNLDALIYIYIFFPVFVSSTFIITRLQEVATPSRNKVDELFVYALEMNG